MTADNLREIVKSHAPAMACAAPCCEGYIEDVGALLDLLRQIANWQAIQEAPGGGEGCAVCWRAPNDHAPDCWWLIAQGAK